MGPRGPQGAPKKSLVLCSPTVSPVFVRYFVFCYLFDFQQINLCFTDPLARDASKGPHDGNNLSFLVFRKYRFLRNGSALVALGRSRQLRMAGRDICESYKSIAASLRDFWLRQTRFLVRLVLIR